MLKKFALVVAAMIAGVVGVTQPALAAGSCPSGWICFFDTSVSANYLEARDWADTRVGECFYMNSQATSWINNRSSYGWKVYDPASCTTTLGGTIYANSSGGMNSTYNNKISAYKRNN